MTDLKVIATKPQKPQADIIILKEFFGIRKGDKLHEFAKEIKALGSNRKLLADGIRNKSFTY